MTSPRLEQLEIQLRRAAASRRHAEVARLAARLGKAAWANARSFPKGDPRAGEAARKLDETLSWTLLMMQAARAACAAELRRVATATRYVRPCGRPGGTPGVYLDA